MDLLRAHFSERTDEMLDLLRRLVEIESPTTDKAGCDQVIRFVASLAGDTGANVTIIPQEDWGDHALARWGEATAGFLILCHLDTVWPLGTLARRPWRVDGGRAYGPGCLDNKASAVIVLTALRGLRELGIQPRLPVTVLFNTEEEMGSRSSRAIIKAEAARASVVLCMEPARWDGSLKVWRKGTGRYTVTALGRAAHAGSRHEDGINAVAELAHQILRLQGMTDYEVGTTVSVGTVQGGTRSNVVPERAKALVDLRVRTAAEGQRMDEAIRGLQPPLPGARLEVAGGLSRPAMEKSPVTLQPFGRAQAIGAELGIRLEAGGSGGASDGSFSAAVGVPTLDGLGALGDGAHSVNEYVLVASLAERGALLAALLSRW